MSKKQSSLPHPQTSQNVSAGRDLDPLLTVDESSKTPEELESYIRDIAETVRGSIDKNIETLTPWFFKNMPQIYYQTVPRADKVRHLSSILTGHVFETRQTVELWNRDRTEVTYIGPGGDQKLLTELAKKLESVNAKAGALYYSHDKLIFIANFFTSPHTKVDVNNKHIVSKIQRAKKLLEKSHPDNLEDIELYLNHLDQHFVMYSTARRIRNTFRMYQKMLSKEGVQTAFEPWDDDARSGRLTVGMKEIRAFDVLEDIQHLINRYGFEISRYFVIHFKEGLKEPVAIMNFNVVCKNGSSIDFDSIESRKLIKALRTLAWVDSDEYTCLARAPYLYSVNATNLMRSVAAWVHILLSKENVYYFSEHKIFTTFIKSQDLLTRLHELFRIRFNPLSEDDRKKGLYEVKRKEFLTQIDKTIDPIERQIFMEGLKFVDHVLSTNYYFDTKTGLAFRISSDVLDSRYYSQKPFGIYFIVGRDYKFFHVRWRDVARGGLRIVTPRNLPEYTYALAGLFDEVYGLSFAQQLKNKDIPEGGSKAVMILKVNGNRDRAAKGAVNALLDLLVREDEIQEDKPRTKMISYYDHEEIIYLGPDENVSNELIIWISEQAERRHYKYAKAFMSSKPGAGINHKEYGVTSEGLNVYVDEVLKFLNIDARKQPFTVKMTGGPDGDVAGNELKILHREYGEKARVVAIADGFGAAYDPAGLNWKEILRLVSSERSIAEFNASKLSDDKSAFVIKADTNENILKRNNLHFVAPADIFIPAGGRPYTVTEHNADRFLNSHSIPTCRAIVEGANIYFTNEARERLQELGVIMIKDSTANKCGVICSSFEVIESLILEEKEFMAIKPIYVQQVIEILRDKASKEAQLLFREYAQHGGKKTLVAISKEISEEINSLTDLMLHEFSQKGRSILEDPLYMKIIYKHCPSILVEKFKERITARLPVPYMVAILSAQIASYIVYREGLGWMESIQSSDIVRAASFYMRNVEDTEKLIEAINKTQIKEKEEIRTILEHSAARVLTMLSLEKSRKEKTT